MLIKCFFSDFDHILSHSTGYLMRRGEEYGVLTSTHGICCEPPILFQNHFSASIIYFFQ